MEEEKFEQEENVTTNDIQEEIKEEVTEIQEEATEPVAENATLVEEIPPTGDDNVENPTAPISKKRLWIIIAAVIGTRMFTATPRVTAQAETVLMPTNWRLENSTGVHLNKGIPYSSRDE